MDSHFPAEGNPPGDHIRFISIGKCSRRCRRDPNGRLGRAGDDRTPSTREIAGGNRRRGERMDARKIPCLRLTVEPSCCGRHRLRSRRAAAPPAARSEGSRADRGIERAAVRQPDTALIAIEETHQCSDGCRLCPDGNPRMQPLCLDQHVLAGRRADAHPHRLFIGRSSGSLGRIPWHGLSG
jgi:hypothetical protein